LDESGFRRELATTCYDTHWAEATEYAIARPRHVLFLTWLVSRLRASQGDVGHRVPGIVDTNEQQSQGNSSYYKKQAVWMTGQQRGRHE
jgi:hypothetical protein